MINSILDLIKKKKEDRALLKFYYEVAQNWENWHVMHQRNVLDKFKLDYLSAVQGPGAETKSYGQKLTAYNKSMDEFKTFEQWYASDVQNKTTENARVLHGKREVAASQFKELLAAIEPLKKSLEMKLGGEGILKPGRKI